MDKQKILVIDDEPSQLELLEIFLTGKGYLVKCADSAKEGLRLVEAFQPDAVILDIHLPDMDGLTVLEELKRTTPKTNIIMITAYHDMETTVKAMKLGACEYITKPIDVDELETAVSRALRLSGSDEKETPSRERTFLQTGSIIGNSRSMKEIFKSIGMLSGNRVTVLIEGETGTGKELIAKAIHYFSPNRDNPFLAVNCSAIVDTLIESELFGHEKGAFTGALSAKKGKFELAGEGTIFLDEIGEIPFELQAKLLRVLQEREFQRVGGEKTLKSSARVIAATNKDLWKMAEEGAYREDLYYRLSVAKIYVPPLRERKEDIGLLIEHLLRKINSELGKNIRRIEQKAMLRMKEYRWPGNVRQLENVLTRAAIYTPGEVILDDAIAPFLKDGPFQAASDQEQPILSLGEMEKEHILKILGHTNWHITRTAEILGISRPTLRQKIKEYKILKQ
ncbi:MAG: Transcriptional regulatory protein ZraR [Syntrophorhabdaceae bacterium PtaU1.Bin034]|jgi:two-component system response regulator AtoC|nr:MAG: Transcriptional regulatory protein ZraR [Syntrophorhabdaceae bacterium PtaU1.Bin034]